MTQLISDLVAWLTSHADHPFLVCAVMFAVLVITGAGVPISEEIITLAAGFLVYHAVLDPVLGWITCYVGILVADMIAVYIGWHFGKAVLHRRWIKRLLHPRRVLWAKHQVHEHGAWMIAASRFIPGTRYPVLLITGMMHLPRWKVLLADGSAAVVTVSLQMFIGWWLAHAVANVGQLMEYHMPIGLGMLAIGVLLVLGYVLVRRRRARRAATT